MFLREYTKKMIKLLNKHRKRKAEVAHYFAALYSTVPDLYDHTGTKNIRSLFE